MERASIFRDFFSKEAVKLVISYKITQSVIGPNDICIRNHVTWFFLKFWFFCPNFSHDNRCEAHFQNLTQHTNFIWVPFKILFIERENFVCIFKLYVCVCVCFQLSSFVFHWFHFILQSETLQFFYIHSLVQPLRLSYPLLLPCLFMH